MSGHLVHFAAPLADRTVCDRDPYDTPHVRVAGAMLSRAAIACPTCLAHVRDPESAAAQIARLEAQADAAREVHRHAQGRAAAAAETARAALSEIAHCNRQIRALRAEVTS